MDSRPLWVIVVAINAPWHGEAQANLKVWFQWKFGVITSIRRESVTEITIVARDGESVAYLEAYRVSVYDVKDCFLWWCRYIGRYAELEQRLPGVRLWTYQPANNVVPKVVTADAEGNVLGYHYFEAVYRSCDDYVYLSRGLGGLSITVTEGVETGFEVDIGISVGSVSLSGLALGGLTRGQGYSIKYVFEQSTQYEILHCIDYLGAYDLSARKYPLIWAFNTYIIDDVANTNNISIVPKHGVGLVDLRLPREKVERVEYTTLTMIVDYGIS